MIMKQNSNNGAAGYVAPEMSYTEISVEKGFAQSGIDALYFNAPDYEDGVTL